MRVYFYKDKPSITEKSAQDTQSDILTELKNRYGRQVMLIPLPIDMEVSTIDIIKESYKIEQAPTILVNEKIKLEGLQSLQEIEDKLDI